MRRFLFRSTELMEFKLSLKIQFCLGIIVMDLTFPTHAIWKWGCSNLWVLL